MAIASAAALVVGSLAISQRAPDRPTFTLVTRDDAARLGGTIFTAPPAPTVAPLVLRSALALPLGTTGARLSSLPDALLNDQPAIRYRVPVEVRGRSGLASVDRPLVVAWSEDGYWYELSTTRLTLARLLEIASALE